MDNMFLLSAPILLILIMLAVLAIWVTIIVLIIKLLSQAIKYLKLKNAYMTKLLYKPTMVSEYDHDASQDEINSDIRRLNM